jgi:hypothetical protein
MYLICFRNPIANKYKPIKNNKIRKPPTLSVDIFITLGKNTPINNSPISIKKNRYIENPAILHLI